MPKCKVLSGLTEQTTQALVLDAGAFFKNYDIKQDTFDSAIKAGKLLGATKGGGNFKAVPTFRSIEIDGMRGAVKEAKLLDSWEIRMGAKIVEVTVESLKAGLSIVEEPTTETVGQKQYKKIQGKTCILDKDYFDNITWIGNLSGSEDPVIIQVFNALNTKGLEFSFEDKGEAVIETDFEGHFDATGKVPFVIYYPQVGVGA